MRGVFTFTPIQQCKFIDFCIKRIYALFKGPVTTSTDEKLVFYSLFKQATIGPCNVPAPAFWNVVQKFKWDSWKNLGDMSSSTAKAHYIHRLKRKISDVNKEYDTDVS
ncbi:unnamed protein product [Nippostrongylus brasiliensis]|uniref:ACB domain-containing protein n=1 Tax=Nippostrongylus brasiliensis TaxID=27835 RepID=A0A0N4XP56_NIPBR|nr:unnamed protein product [Nippostrongylus brasiliensis]